MKSLGERIVQLREIHNLTQIELSKMIGVSSATMSKYENNVSLPNSETLGLMADALDTTADYLIGRTENMAPLQRDNRWITLNEEETTYLENLRLLSEKNKIRIFERMETFLEEDNKGGSGVLNSTTTKIRYIPPKTNKNSII